MGRNDSRRILTNRLIVASNALAVGRRRQAPGVPPDAINYDDARQLKIFGLKPNGTDDFEFNYDDAGNLQTELRPTYTRTYTHNTTNAITQWVDPAQTMLLTHDLNGNLVTEGTSRSYEWDAENRLTKITEGARTSEFKYDGLSRRVVIIEKLGTTVLSDRRYVWCGARPCEERNVTTGAIRRFLSHGFQDGATKYFYTRDHLGSVREVTNSAGSAITRYNYEPWGKQTKLFGTVESPFGYAGYWTQPNGGLNLTWFRGYSPELRRWLSRDPIGEFGGGNATAEEANLYPYVENGPLSDTDLLGQLPDKKRTRGLQTDDKEFADDVRKARRIRDATERGKAVDGMKERADEKLKDGKISRRHYETLCTLFKVIREGRLLFTIPVIFINPCVIMPQLMPPGVCASRGGGGKA